MPFLVFQGSNANATSDRAHLVLPAAAWVEREGTWTNTASRVQRFWRAVPPLGEARADWEILPEVARDYNLSDDPNDRAIGGASSGAICAFNVAWERPDAFRRVVSTIGTYVDLRGGGDFPTLVRKYEPKPIRVFLQDGSNDLNLYAGSWWHANQSMLSALQFANASADRRNLAGPRYEVRHEWGDGAHNDKHGGVLLPEIIRWMLGDWKP